jgi:transketolase
MSSIPRRSPFLDVRGGRRLIPLTARRCCARCWHGNAGSRAVRGKRIAPLGVSGFGQSGDIPDLYRAYELDAQAIETAAERTLACSVA